MLPVVSTTSRWQPPTYRDPVDYDRHTGKRVGTTLFPVYGTDASTGFWRSQSGCGSANMLQVELRDRKGVCGLMAKDDVTRRPSNLPGSERRHHADTRRSKSPGLTEVSRQSASR